MRLIKRAEAVNTHGPRLGSRSRLIAHEVSVAASLLAYFVHSNAPRSPRIASSRNTGHRVWCYGAIVHGPAAMNSPETFGAASVQSMSASRYASPDQKCACSPVLPLGTSFNRPGEVASAASNRILLAPVAEFQNPATVPLTSFMPGTYTLFVSPKHVTSSFAVLKLAFHALSEMIATGVVAAGSYNTSPYRPVRIAIVLTP